MYCLETDSWRGQKDRTTLRPLLDLLEYHLEMPYLHRTVATKEEFEYHISRYAASELKTHPVLYLGFHGSYDKKSAKASLRLANEELDLGTLAHVLNGKLKGRIVHFGACSVFSVHGNTLQYFLRQTQAIAMMGYKEETDWTESAALELLLFGDLQYRAMRRNSIQALDRYLKDAAPKLCTRLGFKMVFPT